MVSWSGNNRIGAGLSVITGAAAQDIVLERIEPGPGQLPCSQQTVMYLCQVMVPSTSLIWAIPNGMELEFGVLREVGNIRNSSDDVYSTNLTSKMEDTDPDSDRFFFSSTLLILMARLSPVLEPLLVIQWNTVLTLFSVVRIYVLTTLAVYILFPPDPPSGLEYDDSVLIETSVDLEWSRPFHTGGVPLMNYSLTASSSGGTLSVSDGREMVSYTTPGLMFGEVQVTAINYCGQQSQPASLNIPAAGETLNSPSQPFTVRVFSSTRGCITLS